MNKKYWLTGLWMIVSVAVIYLLLDMFILTPVLDWIKAFLGW